MMRLRKDYYLCRDLPPVGLVRWMAQDKEAVVRAVENGDITTDEVLIKYDLSLEEYMGWRDRFHEHGRRALKATKIQRYRTHARKEQQQNEERTRA